MNSEPRHLDKGAKPGYWRLNDGNSDRVVRPSRESGFSATVKRRAGPLWQRAIDFAAGNGPPPFRPYQVETHLCQTGRPDCLLRCRDCLGQCSRVRGGLPGEIWRRVIDDFIEMGVRSVIYSGIYTDPLCLDEDLLVGLLAKGGPHWGVKLYTYGLQLTEAIRKAIVQAAVDGPAGQSYVRFSKPTVDARIAQEMCRPSTMDGATLLRVEEDNLQRMFELAEANGFPLDISLNCRVTRINGDPNSLADLLRWLRHTPDRVRLRFTTDYEPTGASEKVRKAFAALYVDPYDALKRVNEAIRLAHFEPVDRLSFRVVSTDSRCAVQRCLNRLLFAAVSAFGRVYPCQGVAARNFEQLSYGDVQEKRFPEIWSDFTRSLNTGAPDPIACGCPCCAAAGEQQINLAMAGAVASARYHTVPLVGHCGEGSCLPCLP